MSYAKAYEVSNQDDQRKALSVDVEETCEAVEILGFKFSKTCLWKDELLQENSFNETTTRCSGSKDTVSEILTNDQAMDKEKTEEISFDAVFEEINDVIGVEDGRVKSDEFYSQQISEKNDFEREYDFEFEENVRVGENDIRLEINDIKVKDMTVEAGERAFGKYDDEEWLNQALLVSSTAVIVLLVLNYFAWKAAKPIFSRFYVADDVNDNDPPNTIAAVEASFHSKEMKISLDTSTPEGKDVIEKEKKAQAPVVAMKRFSSSGGVSYT